MSIEERATKVDFSPVEERHYFKQTFLRFDFVTFYISLEGILARLYCVFQPHLKFSKLIHQIK